MSEDIFYSIDWELFSWIATPFISLLAFVVYGAALYTSIKQNKITTSTSLIPYFEEEIEDAIELSKNFVITITWNDNNINGLNFGNLLFTEMMILKYNDSYVKDVKEGKLNGLINLKDLSYGKNLLFLNNFFSFQSHSDYPSDFHKYFEKILRLIRIIESSELTKSHQKILKFKVRNRLANEFIISYQKLKWHSKMIPEVIPT